MTELTSRLATRTADIEKLETANHRIEAEHGSLEKQIAALKQSKYLFFRSPLSSCRHLADDCRS